ncbi:hypothetical protein SEUBUCD646_0D01240 [Saccharomyces eubayanus]|uniref:Uncharacterized protein n=1 Tax=Saccharomyces eubayanus TaxID=1080349 RepID=A0ABN8VSJ2_SACEU|nr:hypothetical protein SEUBUCD650_0D01230 [Saccharomyces eubayanus]CAI1929478.1 hypothetical protein SEUBUCD646_0D01240 [Saccharomyces eubayanus]
MAVHPTLDHPPTKEKCPRQLSTSSNIPDNYETFRYLYARCVNMVSYLSPRFADVKES